MVAPPPVFGRYDARATQLGQLSNLAETAAFGNDGNAREDKACSLDGGARVGEPAQVVAAMRDDDLGRPVTLCRGRAPSREHCQLSV
eukprot:CAMPEP_0179841330 /NCGR_PEP_ID=MMETSP0982-20121206/2459_1 /TAXON_ID=483367 /ORGANISM="non described non described, Strain CCMP 2436" /LENGTH=86 /DNA_ID=CAMNT_0021725375 /DNA_START=118 /DNA_END=378 /DNA_ORIENTATION=-